MALESQMIPDTLLDRPSGAKVPMVFLMVEDDARKVYDAADRLEISVSSLLRGIIYYCTSDLSNFKHLPDPTPAPVPAPGKKSGRPVKRFLS